MSLYLTDKIYIKNDIFYYEKDGKSYKLQDKNWHIHLNEYGWEKLNKQWIIQLNRSTKKRKFGKMNNGWSVKYHIKFSGTLKIIFR